MSIDAVVGAQWGDEGKGKIVDLLSKNVDVVARFQGGANAGHTVYNNNNKLLLHQTQKQENGTGLLIDISLGRTMVYLAALAAKLARRTAYSMI